jgi:GMP synthase (glutamine-hydrolysing)
VKPIVVIRHQTSAPLGIAAAALDKARVPWRYLDVWKASEWPDIDDVSGLIALGGAMNANQIEDYPFLQRVRSILEGAVERGVPVLGICLGGQLLACALGAEVEPMVTKEVGFKRIEATTEGREDPVMSPFAPSMPVFEFHEDAFGLPPDAELLFVGEGAANQAFRFGRVAYGVQFHFEATERIIADWCDLAPNLEETWGVNKQGLLREARALLPAQKAAALAAVGNFATLTTSPGGS